jgi:hypothetical protein
MKIPVASILAVIALCNTLLANVTLTTFGDTDAPAFTVEGSLTNFPTVTQTASNISIEGNDTNSLAGTFASVNISGMSDFLVLTGTVTAAPSTLFSVDLFDSSFVAAHYLGGSWTDLQSTGSTTLSFDFADAGFNPTDVIALQTFGSGVGSESLSATLAGATAIPEPNSLLLFVLGSVALVSAKRRR